MQDTESAIQAAGADKAPRVKPADIEAAIASEHYFTALQGARMAGLDMVTNLTTQGIPARVSPLTPELGLLTFCVLVLRNGFTVTGESACASPENFNAEIGQQVARKAALEKIWLLEGYALKNRLTSGGPVRRALETGLGCALTLQEMGKDCYPHPIAQDIAEMEAARALV